MHMHNIHIYFELVFLMSSYSDWHDIETNNSKLQKKKSSKIDRFSGF